MNTKKTEISVIIPFYYQTKLLEDTLSILYFETLSLKCFIEVLIVDSNTNAKDVPIEKYIKNDSFISIRIINTENYSFSKT